MTHQRVFANTFSFQITLVLIAVVASACNESFNPHAPFEPRMVVYSVLTTESDTQFVRIYSTYNAAGNNPSTNKEETSVKDAAVTISDGMNHYTLEPITVPRPDQTRYQNDIKAYFVTSFRPEYGKNYVLNVVSPTYGSVSANLAMPGSPGPVWVNKDILENPLPFPDKDVGVVIRLGLKAKAFLARLYVYYESSETGTPTEKRVEVPVSTILVNPQYSEFKFFYPKITRRTTQDVVGTSQYEGQSFRNASYSWTIKLTKHYSINVKFRRAVMYIIQFDDAFYKYYSLSRRFQDPYTIRLDEPDFTNILGGAGVFAGLTVDSLVHQLPEFIPGEF